MPTKNSHIVNRQQISYKIWDKGCQCIRFDAFSREMSPACLFLSCKVEEQPRKLEHVIKVAHSCLHRDNKPPPDTKTEAYLEQAQQLVINENILLQTLGFEVRVEHPHTYVVKATQLVKASKDLSQSSYYLATNRSRTLQMARPGTIMLILWLRRSWWKAEGQQRGDTPTREYDMPGASAYPPSTSQHRHSNHDRREVHHGESGRNPEQQRSSQDHRDGRPDQRREPHPHPERRKESLTHHPDKDRKPHIHSSSSHHLDSRGSTRGEQRDPHHSSSSHPYRKDAQHPSEQRERMHQDSHRKDSTQVKREPDINGRSLTPQPTKPHLDPVKSEQRKDSPVVKTEVLAAPASLEAGPKTSTPTLGPDAPKKTKSETAINFKEYMKRKEKERKEKEMTDKLKQQLEMAKTKVHEGELLNKTFSEGSSKELKHRPPKLDVSLPLPSSLDDRSLGKEDKERPYEVNIKSPIKPHKNITVKSPIKSCDLKQPKLELPKVHITPEKDGVDPFSVNINNDPAIRKLMDNGKESESPAAGVDILTHVKQEPGILPKIPKISPKCSPRVKPESGSPRVKKEIIPSESGAIKDIISNTKIKQEPKPDFSEKVKQELVGDVKVKEERVDTVKASFTHPVSRVEKILEELEPGEIEDSEPEINLLPEHSSAPTHKIKELTFDPEKGLDSAVALKHAMRKEPSSGRNTPVSSQVKAEGGSGQNTPLRMKIPIQHTQGESPSLKIKISTKGISTDSDHSSGKHSSPHRHKHKHKDKHKSHKHSKDRHKDKHREKHSSSSVSSSSGTNGQSLKLNIKLSEIPGSSSSEWANKPDKPKHRASMSDPALNKNVLEPERQQPWSVSDLSKSATDVNDSSASRKRRRTPTVEKNSDTSQSKAAKMGPNRLRRSSSSHSVVSMEMSDDENVSQVQSSQGQVQTNGQTDSAHIVMNKLHEALRKQLNHTQSQIAMYQKQGVHLPPPPPPQSEQNKSSPRVTVKPVKKPVDRQQSGFDLEGMMWAESHPPLPDTPAPPPPPPDKIAPLPPR
ncbi:CCNT1-like protein [Mya arenaria]|uniref:CCNT1-like protein n=1 Tax=Mya arenaria TaxID=6604 RepID=A0ABY7EB04_MYAAR|nr:CCNT1-like protein [Mya arenaria]